MAQESTRLRLESGDGSVANEYRIAGGSVEVRTLVIGLRTMQVPNPDWRQLTPRELSVHVERDTVLARWLVRRFGWRNLLQACLGESHHQLWSAAEHSNHNSPRRI